jgi:hypothetical protein
MELFTSYHAKAEDLHKAGYFIVNISVIFPKFAKPQHYDMPMLLILAPRKEMLNMEPEAYDKAFAGILAGLSAHEVVRSLFIRGGRVNKDKIVLLCYEKDRATCHRSIVGDWITEHTGLPVTEVAFAEDVQTVKQPTYEAPTLF